MEIKSYTASQLQELIDSPEFGQLKHLPISRLRAVSYIHNPRLRQEENLLYIAWIDGEVAGYRLMLHDIIYLDGRPQPMSWYSCVWVDPEKRGLGIAKQMVELAMKDCGGLVWGADPVIASQKLYERTGEIDVPFIEGTRVYFKAAFSELLIERKPALKVLRPLLKLGEGILNLAQGIVGNKPKNVPEYRVIEEVDETTAAFIEPFLEKELFRRNRAELNWTTRYPWIRQGEPDEEDRKYYFSSVAARFEQKHVQVLSGGAVIGYLLLTIREEHLKISYAYFEPKHVREVAKVIWQIAIQYGVSTCTTFHPELAGFFKKENPGILARSIKRYYLVTKSLSAYFKTGTEMNFQAGDGDQAFT